VNRRMKIVTASGVAAILIIVFGWDLLKGYLTKEKLAAYRPPTVAVTTLKAAQSEWTTRISAFGQITASEGVDVTPQIAGQVRSIHFRSGDLVEAGDLLVQLDDQLEQDELQSDEAKVRLSQLNTDRYAKLVTENSAAKATLDRVQAELVSDQAAAHATKTKIDYLAIKAPFSGRLSIREVNLGDFVQPGTTLVNLQDTSVLFVDFSLPESYLPLLQNGLKATVGSEARPDKNYNAIVVAISAQVDPNSRNIDIRAQIQDPDKKLSPGMYVSVTLETKEVTKVFALPDVAISYSLYGDSVFVVSDPVKDSGDSSKTKEYTVAQKYVDVFDKQDSKVAITKGISAGDQIITSNQQQLSKKTIITVNNSVKLDQNAVTGQ